MEPVFEPPHVKTNKMTVHPAKTSVSLGIHPVWSESSLCAQWVAKDPIFLHADSEDSDQTGWMPRLIWVFAWHTVILLVLSWGGSIINKIIQDINYNQIEIEYMKYIAYMLEKHCYCSDFIWATTWPNQQNDCAPSEDSDQPGHPPSVIRVFAVRMKKTWVLSYPLSTQRRLWSDWADAQADLSLGWAHSHFFGFVMRRLILHCYYRAYQACLVRWISTS